MKLWFPIFVFIATGIFLSTLNSDFGKVYMILKKGMEGGSNFFEKRKRYSGGKNFITRFADETDSRIQKSNIRVYVPYGVFLHFLICLICMIVVFAGMSSRVNMFLSLMFAAIGFTMPYIILQIIGDIMNSRIQKYSVDFFIILKNYLKACGGDIFEAYEKAKDSFIEPIKTYTDIMVYEYKHKVNPIRAMDNFIDKLDNHELKIFIENQKICYIHGGDMEELIDEFIKEVGNLNDDSDKETMEDKILNMGLYALLIINFAVVLYILNGQYRLRVIDSLWGQITITADLLISFYIIYMTLRREV